MTNRMQVNSPTRHDTCGITHMEVILNSISLTIWYSLVVQGTKCNGIHREMFKNCFNSWLYIETKICVYLCTKLNNTPCDVWRNGSTTPRVGNLSTRSGTLSGEIYETLALNKVVNWGREKKNSVSTANDFPRQPATSTVNGLSETLRLVLSVNCTECYFVLRYLNGNLLQSK
jgi:hypothetical protein